jgi:hypothetical protein
VSLDGEGKRRATCHMSHARFVSQEVTPESALLLRPVHNDEKKNYSSPFISFLVILYYTHTPKMKKKS